METVLGVEVLLCVLTLILYVLGAQFIEYTKFDYIHESALAILCGGVFGGFVYWISDSEPIAFDPKIFFYCALPPIIFAAGYTLNTSNFFLNIGYICLYGFLGTFISFIILAAFAIFFNFNGALPLGNALDVKECLLLACVLSATDTVAAVSIVKEAKYPKLNSILFGEGVINDAVAIVLFRAAEVILKEDDKGNVEFGAIEATKIFISFLFITTTSIFLGVTFGLL
jgi:NhaP-type Na+/H+ or K+/H+ antiporter